MVVIYTIPSHFTTKIEISWQLASYMYSGKLKDMWFVLNDQQNAFLIDNTLHYTGE